jgi:hypothetical protein
LISFKTISIAAKHLEAICHARNVSDVSEVIVLEDSDHQPLLLSSIYGDLTEFERRGLDSEQADFQQRFEEDSKSLNVRAFHLFPKLAIKTEFNSAITIYQFLSQVNSIYSRPQRRQIAKHIQIHCCEAQTQLQQQFQEISERIIKIATKADYHTFQLRILYLNRQKIMRDIENWQKWQQMLSMPCQLLEGKLRSDWAVQLSKPATSMTAIRLLGFFGFSQAHHLQPFLEETFDELKYQAILSLSRLAVSGDLQAQNILVQRMIYEQDLATRMLIAEGLLASDYHSLAFSKQLITLYRQAHQGPIYYVYVSKRIKKELRILRIMAQIDPTQSPHPLFNQVYTLGKARRPVALPCLIDLLNKVDCLTVKLNIVRAIFLIDPHYPLSPAQYKLSEIDKINLVLQFSSTPILTSVDPKDAFPNEKVQTILLFWFHNRNTNMQNKLLEIFNILDATNPYYQFFVKTICDIIVAEDTSSEDCKTMTQALVQHFSFQKILSNQHSLNSVLLIVHLEQTPPTFQKDLLAKLDSFPASKLNPAQRQLLKNTRARLKTKTNYCCF